LKEHDNEIKKLKERKLKSMTLNLSFASACNNFIENNDHHISKLIPVIVSSILSHDFPSLLSLEINAHEYEIDPKANDCNFCFRKKALPTGIRVSYIH
jgi:hypothetical protein